MVVIRRALKKEIPVITRPGPKKLRWKKITGGISVLANGSKVRKDEIFHAFATEISQAFKRKFVCLDKLEEVEEPGIKITLVPAGKNKWNLVNEYTGDILNEKPLSAADAKAFLEEGASLPEEKPVTKEVSPSKKEEVLKEKAKARATGKKKVNKEELHPVETDDEEEYDD